MLHGGNCITPSQQEAHERSRAFRDHIDTLAQKLKVEVKAPVPKIIEIEPVYDALWREACETLDKVESIQGPRIEVIIRVVAKYFGISRLDLISDRRTAEIVLPRHIAMYLARRLTTRSLPEIGRRFGKRDHTVVIFAVRKIENLIRSNPEIAEHVRSLTEELTA